MVVRETWKLQIKYDCARLRTISALNYTLFCSQETELMWLKAIPYYI